MYNISSSGDSVWCFVPSQDLDESIEGSAIIFDGGRIYVASYASTQNKGYLFALNLDGSIIWQVELGSRCYLGGMTIGLDGTIFTVTQDGYLHAITHDGTLKWKSNTAGFLSDPDNHLAISPDGSALYINSSNNTFCALNTTDGSTDWELPSPRNHYGIMVDNQGLIYHNISDSTGPDFACIDPSGVVKWKYNDSMYDCVMDWDGYIYIFTDYWLHALDHEGNFRWKRRFLERSDWTPLISDKENVIYAQTFDGIIHAINQDGEIIFEKTIQRGRTDMGAIGRTGTLYCSRGWDYDDDPLPGCFIISIR